MRFGIWEGISFTCWDWESKADKLWCTTALNYCLSQFKRDKSIFKKSISEKFRKKFYFFTYILPDYMAHDIPKDFLKNNHFENMTAGFPLSFQNLTWQITHKMMHGKKISHK